MGYQLKTCELLSFLYSALLQKTLYSCCKDTRFIVFSATIYAYLHLLVEFTY